MSEVRIAINGRSYDIACDPGSEGRIMQLATYIDQRLHQISRSGAAYNDAHLLILTALVLADELFETREGEVGQKSAATAKQMAKSAQVAVRDPAEDEVLLKVISHLAGRIDMIASKVEAA